MKLVITGGTGFVGSNLINELKKLNHEIICFTRGNSWEKDGVKYIKVDYSNFSELKDNLKCDILIHLAATLFARSKKEFIKENVTATRNLVEAARANEIKKIIYLSSLAAGGPALSPEKPKKESESDNPVSYYGLSKLMSEHEIKKFKRWTILRPPIVYGPKDSGFSTIAEWVRKGIMISPANPNARFSFIFVGDLVKCIIKSMDDSLDGETFYVSERKTYSWDEFITIMAENMNVRKPKIIKMPGIFLKISALSYEIFSYITKSKPVLNRDKVREAIASHWICDPSKWEEKTKINEWTQLREGFKKTFPANI